MDIAQTTDHVPGRYPTTARRQSDLELIVTRTFDAPVRIVFQAWSDFELFKRWWIPKSSQVYFVSSRADIRTGGSYSFEMGHPAFENPMTFFGRYLEVTPNSRIVWTNEEAGPNGSVTTVTFEERDGKTHMTLVDRYPTKEALDAAIESGATSGYDETFSQLEAVLTA